MHRTGAALAILVLAVAGAAVASSTGGGSTSAPAGTGEVVEVIDGDTVVLRIGGASETTRLLGIDTPETNHPTRPVECFGVEASARLSELVPPGTTVRLERDTEARDHYGRLLLYLYVTAADGAEIFVNQALVADGYAVALPIDPNRAHRSTLADAERVARAGDAGLWGTCGGPGVAVDGVLAR